MLRRVVSWLVYLLVWVTVCIHVQAQSACSSRCSMADICTGANVIEEITGASRRVRIPCNVTLIERLGYMDITPASSLNRKCESNQGPSKYIFESNSDLRVNCLEPSDEGVYQCVDGTTKHCLLITTLVDFTTCPMGPNVIDCPQTLYVSQDDPIIMFDTRLTYNNNGSICRCDQVIRSYRFFNEEVDYTCHSPTNCTSSMGNITQYNGTSDGSYNFFLQLHSPKPANGTTFTFQIVGEYPTGIEGVYTITKIFTLYFEPSASTTSEPSTMPPTGGEGVNPDLMAIIGAACGSVAFLIIIVVVFIVVLVIILYFRFVKRQGVYKSKQTEALYAEIDDVKSNRSSKVYSSFKERTDGNVELSPTLESMSVST